MFSFANTEVLSAINMNMTINGERIQDGATLNNVLFIFLYITKYKFIKCKCNYYNYYDSSIYILFEKSLNIFKSIVIY